MEDKDKKVILRTSQNTGHFDRMTDYEFDVNKRTAKFVSHGGGHDDKVEKGKRLFEENINMVRRLARKEIEILGDRIKNNKNVLVMFPDDEVEQKRTKRHLERNEYKREVLEQFLEETTR